MQIYDRHGSVVSDSRQKTQTAMVYLWMFLGLIFTGVSAFIIAANKIVFGSGIFLLIIAEFVLVWYLGRNALRMSFTRALVSFFVYSILNGITISSIFYIYSSASIAYAFFVSAIFFGVMTIYGLFTKSDLTSIGPLLTTGLICIIIVSIINIFFANSTLNWIISFVGVAIFLGLTAYHSQTIKQLLTSHAGSQSQGNLAIIGALMLYLDFLNLFMYILRILGRRRID